MNITIKKTKVYSTMAAR